MLGDRAILMPSIPTKGGWFLRNRHEENDTFTFACIARSRNFVAERGAERDDGAAGAETFARQ